MKQPKGLYGTADIIDFGERGLYEIKPISAPNAGFATATIYMKAWNDAVDRGEALRSIYLDPGLRYPWKDTIVGTDPEDSSQWVKAKLVDSGGVILYWGAKKSKWDPIPVFVFEWAPEKQKVEKRKYAIAYTEFDPDTIPTYPTDSLYDFLQWLLNCGGIPVILDPEIFTPAWPDNGTPFDIR